ncbi:MAG: SRPBCC domain-containing protein [Candidatus Coatesbacteria bacterium]|nr:MAG: SRPBCC domain-containing protein [Candidatus Coatesbacteria bacterium]
MFWKSIKDTVEINASPESVWRLLTTFEAYPEWNRFIRYVKGEPKAGARVEVAIQPPGGREMTFRPIVTAVEPGRELRWRRRLWAPGVFTSVHFFRIEPTGDNRVKFIQAEKFSGLLVPFVGKSLYETTLAGFRQMNETLKRMAEG